MKRTIAVLLLVCILLGYLPTSAAYAQEFNPEIIPEQILEIQPDQIPPQETETPLPQPDVCYHSYTETVTSPGCEVQGYTTHTCTLCGSNYVDAYTSALGHSWDGGVDTLAPTETATGVKTYTCYSCGGTYTEDIPVLTPVLPPEPTPTQTPMPTSTPEDMPLPSPGIPDMGTEEDILLPTPELCELDYEQRNRIFSRNDGTWLFPTEQRFYDSIMDWNGCRGQNSCLFCGTVHNRCMDAEHAAKPLGAWGLDIMLPLGANVYAAANGTIWWTYNEWEKLGYTAIIEHPAENGYSYYSVLTNLSQINIDSGSEVAAGAIVALSGKSGGLYEPEHLRFMIFMAESGLGATVASDPISWLALVEQQGWLEQSQGRGMINNNPSAYSTAVTTMADYTLLTELQNHPGTVSYSFDASAVTVNPSIQPPDPTPTPTPIPTPTAEPTPVVESEPEEGVNGEEGDEEGSEEQPLLGGILTSTGPSGEEGVAPAGTIIDSGTCGYNGGDNLTWTLDDAGSLTISGQGEMEDYLSKASWGKYNKDIKSVVIDYGVTYIGLNAFSNCESLTSVELSYGVTTIGQSAFSNCDSLATITLPDSVTSIRNDAFYDCDGLKTVIIPDNVSTIGRNAFYSCDSLESVAFSENLISVGEGAFGYCTKLQAVYINNLAAWCRIDFGDSFGNPLRDNGKLYLNNQEITAVTVPDGVTRIGNYAFSYDELTSVTIPNSVTIIGDGAFHGCRKLEKVIIPESVKIIGKNAFRFCRSIVSVLLHDGVTSIGEAAFSSCISLESVKIPYGVTVVEKELFSGCEKLTSVTIPDSVIRIGDSAFSTCTHLTDIELPEGLTSIGYSAFYYSAVGDLVIPDSVTSIGEKAFYECAGLTDITIPGSVTTIEDSTFGWCDNLESVTIENGVTDIEKLAFYRCPKLKSVSIPPSVTKIGDGAFESTYVENLYINDLTAWCNIKYISEFYDYGHPRIGNLYLNNQLVTDLIIPDEVTSIREEVFGSSTSITSVIIPNSVTCIGRAAFANCYSLETVKLGEKVSEIGSTAFFDCFRLKSITIPASVESIGIAAFSGCENLKDVYFVGTRSQWEKIQIADNNDPLLNATIHFTSSVGNVGDLELDKLSIVCYGNTKNSEKPDESFELLSGVTVTVGDKTYTTDEKGQVTIEKPTSAVTFSKENYSSRTIGLQKLAHNSSVYMQKKTGNSSNYPVINALWAGNVDILHEELPLKFPSDETFILEPEIDWGLYTYDEAECKINLYQEGKSVGLYEIKDDQWKLEQLNKVALAQEFDVSEDLFLAVENPDGLQSRKLLKTRLENADILDGFTFSLGDGISFTLPESASIFSGKKMSLDFFSPLEANLMVEDGKVFGAIGCGRAWETDDEGKKQLKSFSQSIKNLRDKVSNAKDTAEQYRTLLAGVKEFGDDFPRLKGSFGVDGSWRVMIFVEGYLDDKGNVEVTDSGGFFMFESSAKYSQPFLAGPVPMFFEVKVKGDIGGQINLFLKKEIKQFTPALEIQGTIGLSGELGVGSSKLLGLSSGLEGDLENLLNIGDSKIEYYKLTASLKWYIKLKFMFSSWKDGLTLGSSVWYEYPDPGQAMSLMTLSLDDEPTSYSLPRPNEELYGSSGGSGKPDFYDISQYRNDDLSYLQYGSSFMGGGRSLFNLRNRSNAPFVSNAYDGADPQTAVFSDGTRLAVWIGYNTNYSGPDALNLYCSYYNGEWSQPQVVENDGTTDAAPCLKVINDVAYLVWQDASGSISSDASIASVANMMEISGAVFDKARCSFSSSSVTNGSGVLNTQPVLCGDSSGVYVVWHRNGLNDWFGQNYANSFLSSSFTGSGWSGASTLYSGLGPIVDFDAYSSGGSVSVAYTMDGDCDLNTIEDMEVYLNGAQQSSNEYLDSGVCFSGGNLYWYSGGQLMVNGYSTLVNGALIGSDRFQILNENGVQAVIYSENDGLYSTLYAAYYSGGSWGSPIVLYSAGTSIPYFSASTNENGEIVVLIQSQAVVGGYDSEDPYGETSLVWFNAPMGCNIRVDDVRFYNENYVAGKDMPIHVTVNNTGELAVSELLVEILDDGGNQLQKETIAETILSGQTKELLIYYNVSEIEQGKSITVKVSPAGMVETDTEDNASEMVLGWNDLAIENIRWGVLDTGETVIHASLVNRGYDVQENVKVELIQDTASGPVVDSAVIEEVGAFSLTNVSFTIAGTPARIYYVRTEHKESDCDYGNDASFIEIKSNMPTTGDCGEGVSWSYDEATGTLTISGTGAMEDYESANVTPWNIHAASIDALVVENGVSSIGENAFANCSWINNVSIGGDVSNIGSGAFANLAQLKEISFSGDAPSIAEDTFTNVTATVKYPVLAEGWEDIVNNSFGGTITWEEYYREGENIPEVPEIPVDGSFNGSPADVDEKGSLLINKENFPDANFRSYIIGEFDTENKGYLTVEQVDTVTKILCSSKNISNLKGIEYFTSLVELSCANNQLETLDLRNNTALTKLVCVSNDLTSLNISGNSLLTELFCEDNQLTALDMSNNPALTELSCYSNQLTTLDLSGNTALSKLSASYQSASVDAAWDGNNCVLDLGAIVGKDNLGHVRSVEGGDLDITTGIISITDFQNNATQGKVSYSYDTGSLLDDDLMRVFFVVKIPEIPSASISGKCGDNLTWSFDSTTGTLNITGSGEMYAYNTENKLDSIGTGTEPAPWARYARQIKSVHIGEEVTSIGACAFVGCNALSTVKIPANVSVVSQFAFYDCNALTNISFESEKADDSLTLGLCAFYCSSPVDTNVYVKNLQSYPQEIATYTWAASNRAIHIRETIPTGNLPTGSCGDNLTWVFNEETGTLSITGSGAMYHYNTEDGLDIFNAGTEPAPWAGYASQIKSVQIGEEVTSIGACAFVNCKALSSVNIPESVELVNQFAFYGCDALRSIGFEHDDYDNLDISMGAFYCSNLTDTTIYVNDFWLYPNAITTYPWAMSSRNIVIREPVAAGTAITGWCGENLTWRLAPDTGVLTISGNGTMYDFENSSPPWELFRSYITSIEVEDGVASIGDCAFSQHKYISNITLPEGLLSVGGSAFSSCWGLHSIELPDSVSSISGDAFNNCIGLQSVDLPSSLKTIGPRAFQLCVSLKELSIPASVTSIGEDAFFICRNLSNIRFGHTADQNLNIEDGAFALTMNTNVAVDVPAPLATIITVRNLSKVHAAISGYDWQGSYRSVTYEAFGKFAVNAVVRSWNNEDDLVSALYASHIDDDTVRSDISSGNANAYDYLATSTGTESQITGIKFESVEEGSYKLAIYKPGKYVVSIKEVTVSEDTKLGEIRLWLYGDVTNDGLLRNDDVQNIQRYIVGLSSVFTEGTDEEKSNRLTAANVTFAAEKDNIIESGDALQIQRYIKGLNSVFSAIK